MNRALQFVVFLVPFISMIGGLAAAIIVTIFLLLVIMKYRKKCYPNIVIPFLAVNQTDGFCGLQLAQRRLLREHRRVPQNPSVSLAARNGINNNKLISASLLWCFVCCFWSISIEASLFLWIRIASLIIVGLIITWLDDDSKNELKVIIIHPLMLGIIAAIILFFIEYSTNGMISIAFRSILQSEDHRHFALSLLDRGCALLSVVGWAVIGYLLHNGKKFFALLLYCVILYLLSISDSLASFIAYILGAIAFLLLIVTRMRIIWAITASMIFYTALMPIASYYMNPHNLSEQYEQMPDSAKHRLFIWNFVAKNAKAKPLLGWGFDSSRYIPIDMEKDIIHYQHYIWSPLPLHPHNNVLQILLETGILGLLLFAAMIRHIFVAIMNYTKDSDIHWRAIFASCFINYFVIGMISFGMWQLWWVATGVFAMSILSIVSRESK